MLKGGGRVLLSKIQRAQHTCDSIANISGVWRCFSEVWCWGQLLWNYFFTIHNYCVTTSEIAKTTWVPKPRFSHVWGGGVLAARSQESCLRHSQLWSRHSQPQSAYLSAVRACDHVNTSNATAKCQVARGFHIHTTHCQHIFQKNTDFTKKPRIFIRMLYFDGFEIFPYLPHF